MDAYQDSSRSATRPSDAESLPAETRSLAPTPSDLAQWKEESDRFLHDVRRRLNDIVAELDGSRMVQPAVQAATRDPATESSTGNLSVEPARSDDDRISALKAQLARKLRDFEQTADLEQTTDGPFNATSGAEAGA